MLVAGLSHSRQYGHSWKKFVSSLGSYRGTVVRDQCKVGWVQAHRGPSPLGQTRSDKQISSGLFNSLSWLSTVWFQLHGSGAQLVHLCPLSAPALPGHGNNNPLRSWPNWFSGWRWVEPRPGRGPHLETPGILGLATLFLKLHGCNRNFKGPGLFVN